MASPLPSTRPNSGISSDSWATSAPAVAATAAVPSAEAASTTSTCPAVPAMDSTIGPTVVAHSRAGSTTETADRSRSPKSVCVKLRTGRALSSQGMAKTRSHTPWSAILEEGREDERLVRTARYGARPAKPEPVPHDLHPALLEALERTGVDKLWSHQAAALESAWQGPTIVTTGTASGKSLAFNLPVLDTLARDPRARAIYIYPTKALAQDQARKLHELRAPFLRHAIYDGDTPREERRAIRQRSNLILTNPDMLHVGVLPHHRNWGDVLANLAFVVVDEAHVYRGV